MSEKVYQYLTSELKTVTNKKQELADQIHQQELKVDSIIKKVKCIIEANDTTEIPFYSTNSMPGFESKEKLRLLDDKKQLERSLCVNKDKLDLYAKKEKQLQDLIKEAPSNTIKNTQFDIVKANELERQRIARDIHDTVVQNMTALIYKNEFMKQIIDADYQRVKLELDENSKIIRSCIDELRSIIYDLRPMSINDLNFREAFSNIISHMKSNTNMIIEYTLDQVTCSDSIVLISIIRIIQELCIDSIKYSCGQKININIKQNSDIIFIDYKDDGIGFDIKQVMNKKTNNKSNSGFGLSIINDRILLLNGSLTYYSEKGKGVSYSIKIPVCKESNQCQ